uniref:Maturase n=1 Tax=Brugia timori TaxID=42155 RepID=A0A0R3Q750_9BILA
LRKIIDNSWKYYVKGYVNCHDIFSRRGGIDSSIVTVPTIIIIYDESTDALSQLARCFDFHVMKNCSLGSYKGITRRIIRDGCK